VEGCYAFSLNAKATEKCKVSSALHEQQDCALFFQAMCVLHGDDYQLPMENTLISDLSDVICYVDFSNIFDRNAAHNRYLAFKRSNSMSRKAQLSFVREDFYEPLRRESCWT
jgi:hypothetical protein